MLPLNVPPFASTKLSSPAPPVRLPNPLKATPPTLPAFAPLIVHVFATSAPTKVSFTPSPVTVSMLVKFVPTLLVTAAVTAE